MIKPYNELWMDCLTNNLIAMLACQNQAFLKLPCYMDTIYLKKVYNQTYSSEGTQEELMSFGLYFPKIQYSLELLNNYIDIEHDKIDQNHKRVHEIIKSKLDDGYCVFITVDRFFYPTGVNADISHMMHSTFIYGYNNDNQNYLALEDCITMGKMDYYEIPYESINMSSEYILSIGKTINLQFCKANATAKKFNDEIQISQVIKSLERMLLGGRIYNKGYDLYYHCGLEALSAFYDEIGFLYNNLTDENLYRVRILSFCHYHKRNLELITLLTKYHDLNIDEIMPSYEQLLAKWTIYKNKSYYLLEKRKISGNDIRANDLEGLKNSMKEIIDLERSTNEKMLFLSKTLAQL